MKNSSLLKEIEERIHAVALRALDLSPADRNRVVEMMFTRRRRDAVSYWLQLLLSMAIATVGLVLGSTAVVIGAMLIAPLMGPIVELGMGLVVGSPLLTIRSFSRMAGSVLAVVAGAALLTILLPFQEVNAEIGSRTSPTALDLLLAVFVAIAAAFTTARPGSDSTSAAAGTAIGIALVPPVCVIGFGLGIQNADVAEGATLLFLTNLTAILVVSVLFFLALGFETVDIDSWEEDELAKATSRGLVRRSVNALRAVFGSRYGRVLRVGLPVVLVMAVAVPLSQALEQVAWEVQARSAVTRILDETLSSQNAVQSRVTVRPGIISIQLYLVSGAESAADLEDELRSRVAAASGVVPSIRVVAVPDLSVLQQAAGQAVSGSAAVPVVGFDEMRQNLDQAIRSAWPEAQLGSMLGWRLEVPDSAPATVVIDHLGSPAGPAADALLGRSISERTAAAIAVHTRSFSPEPAVAAAGRADDWLPALTSSVEAVRSSNRLHLCVAIPAPQVISGRAALQRVAERVRAEARTAPERITVDSSRTQWSVQLSRTRCVHDENAGGSGGSQPASEQP